MAQPARAAPESALPRPDHVVILVDENHAPNQVLGRTGFLTALSRGGAVFTGSVGVAHPSQPNYLALFSGTTQGLASNSCPHTFSGANLGSQLRATGRGFVGYAQGMPVDGYTGCQFGPYRRKHNPWVNFSNLPANVNLRFSRFPADFTALPTVAIVVPDQDNDMHDGSVAAGDAWAAANLGGYARWAMTHNSLLIVTFDESNDAHGNQVPTVFYGQPVRPGSYPGRIDHYSVLRTLEDMYGLPCLGNACAATPITGAWR
ncbi:MAG: acid phosphatase [Actinobacteria bacterium 13_2_20CM_2_71_6]|nr:MAG: acid phosphatase [Actinobacteria bacterium 13_2_20CM_2_71_6]